MGEETTEEQQVPEEEEQESTRERFDQEVVRRIFEFAGQLVSDIPELEVVTVVPSWGIPQQDLTPAVYVTREGSGMSPHQLMLVTDRMIRALEFQVGKFREFMLAAGDAADKQAEILNERQQAIEEKEAQLAELEKKDVERISKETEAETSTS